MIEDDLLRLIGQNIKSIDFVDCNGDIEELKITFTNGNTLTIYGYYNYNSRSDHVDSYIGCIIKRETDETS